MANLGAARKRRQCRRAGRRRAVEVGDLEEQRDLDLRSGLGRGPGAEFQTDIAGGGRVGLRLARSLIGQREAVKGLPTTGSIVGLPTLALTLAAIPVAVALSRFNGPCAAKACRMAARPSTIGTTEMTAAMSPRSAATWST